MFRGGRQRLRAMLFVGVGVLTTALVLAAYLFDVARRPELDTVDARFSIKGDREPPRDIVVVGIDDTTFRELDVRPPLRRSLHARVMDRISRDRPKVIAFDLQFTEQTDPAEDTALIEAVGRAHGKVVLTTTELGGEHNIFGGEDVLREYGGKAASANLPIDPGGVARRAVYSVEKLKTLAVVAAETASGKPVSRDAFHDEEWIDFYGPPGAIPAVSFSHVLRGRSPSGFFRDKIVVVGLTAPSEQDTHPTSTSGDGLMSGAEVQANAISTVVRGLPLTSVPGAVNVLMIVLLGMATPLASLGLRARAALGLALAIGLVYAAACQLLFNEGVVVSVLYPLAALMLSAVGAIAVYFVTEAFERVRVREVFARFVPHQVVDDVLASAADDLRLPGIRREATVMFSDLRGFTSFAESLTPERVIEFLNRYLSTMSDAILDNGGTLVAYMGDGIMAVFGAPLEQEDHADRALAAAHDMLRRLERFNEWMRSEGLGEGFKMGIGLNSGPLMSGNVGSERRVEYTAVGDTTNTAARLEGMTKGTPHQIFMADSTRALLADEPPDLIFVEEVEVRGRQQRVRVWAPAATSPVSPRESLVEHG